MAMIDPVSGAFSRQYFETKSKREIERVIRNGSALSLLMIDIDYFKKVNVTYGHQIGDEILHQVTLVIKNNIPATDMCARYGGRVSCPTATSDSVGGTAYCGANQRNVVSDTTTFVTVSIGLSSNGTLQISMDELVKQAVNHCMSARKTDGIN